MSRDTHSTQILQKKDEHNTYVVKKTDNVVTSW